MNRNKSRIFIGLLVIAVLLLPPLLSNNIGLPGSKLEEYSRKSGKIDSDWSTTGRVSDTMAAFISCRPDLSDHSFSVYVNRPGLSFGYFFRSGGNIDIENDIAGFTLDGYKEAAYISVNKQKTAKARIDDGNSVKTIEIDANSPFAIVLPIDNGDITFYDIDGNIIKPITGPM